MNKIEKISNPRIAMTNNIKIKGDLKDNILKLLKDNISINSITLNMDLKNKERYKKMHADIKEAIADELNIEKNKVKKYEIYIDKKKCYFFYLNEKNKEDSPEFVDYVEKNKLDFKRIFSSLINLSLKSHIFNKIKAEGLNIPASTYNSDLYINAISQNKNKKNGSVFVDTFRLNMFYSKFDCLVFNLISKTFNIDLNEDVILDDFLILGNNKKYNINEEKQVNAIKYNKTNYIDFSNKYNETKNYSEQYILKMLKEILEINKIEYEHVLFNPQLMSTKFLNYEKELKNKIIIIDNYNYKTGNLEVDKYNNQYKLDFHKNITEAFKKEGKDVIIQEPQDNNWWREIDPEFNYIVINKENKNGSSIIHYLNEKEEYIDKFEEAFEIYIKEKEYNFDSYTNLKIFNHQEENRRVIQGLNIENLYINQNGRINFKPPFLLEKEKLPQIKKICLELWLKEKIFRERKLLNFDIEDGKYNIYYTRRKNKDKVKVHVVEVEVVNKELIINKYRENNNIGKIIREENKYPILKKSNYKEFNETFCIYDIEKEELLTIYSDSIIPRIIGNPDFNSFDLYQEKKSLHRGSKEDCVLPFLINPKRKSFDSKKGELSIIAIDNKNNYVDIFITSKQAIQGKINKSNLIYRSSIINNEGENINLIGNSLFDFFLKTHVEDIVVMGNVSRSSLMKKIIKEFSN